MDKIYENINIKSLCTIKIGGLAKYVGLAKNKQDLLELLEFAKTNDLKIFPIGKGSNTVFNDTGFHGLLIKLEIPGFEILFEDNISTTIKIGAGEIWDSIVEKTVDMGLSGIEAMSQIPGTAGATPIQNVGAYGQEISETLIELEAYDLQTNQFVILKNKDCEFEYRNSRFKTREKGRFIITSITLKLSKTGPKEIKFNSLKKYFEEKDIKTPSIQEIRDAVIEIRKTKLPDPSIIPNVGSFFENPIISKDKFEDIKVNYPDIINFDMPDGKVKLFAGWLIEKVGLKGFEYKNLQVYEKSALVIINKGESNFKDLEELKDLIIKKVEEKFGIVLETEPEFVQS